MKIIAAVIIALISCGLISCQSHANAGSLAGGPEKPPVPVHAIPVSLFTPQTGERYSASLVPLRQITLSFRVAGFVTSIYRDGGSARRLEPGDLVPMGTVLAVLRGKDYEIAIRDAQGRLESLRRNIEVARAAVAETEAGDLKAESAWRRARTLFEERALTISDFEAAKAQRDIARARLDSARAQVTSATAQADSSAAALSSAELAKADTAILAPYTARLLQRSIEVGSLVSSGQPAFTLADTDTLKAVFGVPDSSVIGLKVSDAVTMSVEAVPGEFTGAITSISALADTSTRLYMIEASYRNQGGLLRPGMIATVSLHSATKPHPVTVVPLSSINRSRSEADGFSLMVVRDNHVFARPVSLSTTYGDRVAVTGVQPDEMVVTSGASELTNGERVEVIR
jgi:multidrug efflux system membrane fusion protein